MRATRQRAEQRGEVLLHAVVDVPLDAPPFLVLGLDDAGARRGELGGLLLDLTHADGQLVRLADAAQAERGFTTERAEQSPVGGAQLTEALRPALQHAELLAALDERDREVRRRPVVHADAGHGERR